MDFGDMEDEVLPAVNVEQLINDFPETDNCVTEETQTKQAPTVDNCAEQMTSSGDCVVNLKFEPFATTSKSKQVTVTSEAKNKGIQEFVRILRPHLPRKSKNKAYRMLQNIAKGIVADNSFQRGIRQKKPKKSPPRKSRARNKKTKSLVVHRNARSMFGSSDSCMSEVSCPRCGYSGCRLAKY